VRIGVGLGKNAAVRRGPDIVMVSEIAACQERSTSRRKVARADDNPVRARESLRLGGKAARSNQVGAAVSPGQDAVFRHTDRGDALHRGGPVQQPSGQRDRGIAAITGRLRMDIENHQFFVNKAQVDVAEIGDGAQE